MQTPPVMRVVERELLVSRRLWRGWTSSHFVMPLLYLTAMGVGLGDIIDDRGRTVDGLAYMEFVAPGLLAATALMLAAGESLWPVMVGTKWLRTFHAMVATPLGPGDAYDGILAWTALRAFAGSALFLTVATLFGGVPSAWGLLAVPAAALGAAAFAAPLIAYSATQDSDATFPLIMRLGVMPLFLFSGTFFPVSQLPDTLQPVAVASPLWHSVELCRGATRGDLGAAAALAHLVVLVSIVAAGRAWGRRSFTRKLVP
ncbi:MAG: ABC transporter permease [Acidimicrobiia bacterium]|nr:ABC transporter permease [Acidimicrobiia bacterium]